MGKVFKSPKFMFLGALIFLIMFSGAFLFYVLTSRAGTLSSASVAPATANYDDLVGATNASTTFSMTNQTELVAGDVVQITFPTVANTPPFTFTSPAIVATSSIIASTTVVTVGGNNGLTMAFTVKETVSASTAFSVTINGINNPVGQLSNLRNLVWSFTTGTPADPASPAGSLSTTKDTVASVTRSLGRAGGAMQSAASTAITPSSYSAAATNVTYTFVFTASTSIPVGGKIAINFPSEFSLLNASTSDQNDINGSGTGAPRVLNGNIATSTANSANRVILTVSNAAVNAGDTVTVAVTRLTNPAQGVYRPFFIYTTKANNGLIDGSSMPGEEFSNYSGPPPVDTIHVGGTNTMTISVYKDTGSGRVKLTAAEIAQFRVGIGCPDKQFFVGMRYLDSNGSTTASNLLDCNYMIGVDGAQGNAMGMFQDYLKPGMTTVPAIGGVTKTVDMAFGVPDATFTGAITGGVANSQVNFQAFNGQYENWMPVFSSTAYTTTGLDGSGNGYFKIRVKTGSSWKINFMGGVLSSGGNKYWPPVIPATYASTTNATTSLGTFAYELANKSLAVTIKNAATGATITSNTCVGVKRSGGGVFMGSQEMYCGAASDGGSDANAYEFKVPQGDVTIEVMKQGIGKPDEYSVAVGASGASKTIYVSSPTSYITVNVLDSSGTAINGAPVFAQSSSGFGEGITNTSGQAIIYVPVGSYRVEGFAPGLGPLTAQTGVNVTSGSNPTVTFTVNTGDLKTIQGTVTQGGAGLSNVQIGARGYGSTSGGNGTVTGSDGTYTLRVPAGTYKVGGWSQGTGGLPEQTVNVSSANATGVDWALGASGTLRVIVAGGANVSPLFANAFDNSTGRGNGTDTWVASSTTDKYADITLPAGTYEVHVGSPVTGEIGSTAAVVITAGQTATTTYSVASVATMVTLDGNVKDASSNNVEDANVWVSRVGGPGFYSTLTDSSGNYSIKIPDARTYKVGVRKGGYLATDVELAISGNTTRNFTLSTAGVTITGKVTYDGSTGIADGWVSAKKTGVDAWVGGPTDSAGNYSLDVDTGSSWTIYADAPCYLRDSTGISANAGDSSKNFTLTARSGCTPPQPMLNGITGATGGQASNGDKIKIDIPPNALTQDNTTVSVSISDAALAKPGLNNTTPLANSTQTVTATYMSGSTQTSITGLSAKATITLTYQESDLPLGYNESKIQLAYKDTTTGNWETIAATVDTELNTLTATIDHFTDLGAVTEGVPEAPQNLSASAVSSSQINLSWNASENTTYYNVYRSTSSGGTYTAIASSTVTSYSDTGLTADTVYYYKIIAANSNGYSSYSSSAYAGTNPATSSAGSSGGGIVSAPAFSVSDSNLWIDQKPTEVSSRDITLKFNVADATHLAISNSSSFDNVAWETYAMSKSWTLTGGDGSKTVYVKFRNTAGTASEAKTLSVKLKGQGFAAQEQTTTTSSGAKGDGALIKYASSDKVYVLDGGKRRWIKTAEVFNSSGYDWKKIVVVADTEKYDDGPDKSSAERASGTLIKYTGDPKVYVLESGKKRWIPDAATFTKLGYSWNKIVTVDSSQSYTDGDKKSTGEKTTATASTPAPAATGAFTKNLSKGTKHSEVKLLQDKLRALGYLAADTDSTGYYGNLTVEAVKKFQKANGISAVGYVGPKTREALNR